MTAVVAVALLFGAIAVAGILAAAIGLRVDLDDLIVTALIVGVCVTLIVTMGGMAVLGATP